jgi:hypothetical protein
LDVTPTLAKTRYALDGTGNYVDMFTADNSLGQAAPADVRSGTVYANGNLTGTCAVPAAASVGFGVPVDDTTGTAALTPAAVWEYATREITGGVVDTLTNAPASVTPSDIWSHSSRTITGGTVDTLTNAPTVPTAAAIADEVRVELAAELANLDAPVSGATAPSAAAVASQVRTELTAELAKVSALNTERLANVATTAIVGNLLAQANS